jgi:hypothetical protein
MAMDVNIPFTVVVQKPESRDQRDPLIDMLPLLGF